jgi:hypothetical protein
MIESAAMLLLGIVAGFAAIIVGMFMLWGD